MRAASTVRTVLADLGREVLDLVVPRECLGCTEPGRSLCPDCASALWVDTGRRDPVPRPSGLPVAWSAAPYRDLAREAILAHKERGDRGLTAPLGRALAAAVAGAVAGAVGPVLLVPVPTARRAIAARGDDTVALIARMAAAVLRRQGTPALTAPVLANARRRADQAGLGAAARAANLAESMRPRARARRLAGRGAVVVVDDVLTTGATLVEASRAVRVAGLEPVAVATVAAAVRRTGDRLGPRPVTDAEQV